jgi:hypothetical protein
LAVDAREEACVAVSRAVTTSDRALCA